MTIILRAISHPSQRDGSRLMGAPACARWRSVTAICLRSPLLLAVCLSLACHGWVSGQTPGAPEYKVKTAYIYNFCRYIDWPDNAFAHDQAPLVIGIVGDNPFGSSLAALADRQVKGRSIVTRHFQTWRDYEPCHVVFVSQASDRALRQVAVNQTRGQSTLIVGETEGFAGDGAAVNFYLDADGTIGFEINVDAARRQRLRVNAKLLNLARVVQDVQPDKEDD